MSTLEIRQTTPEEIDAALKNYASWSAPNTEAHAVRQAFIEAVRGFPTRIADEKLQMWWTWFAEGWIACTLLSLERQSKERDAMRKLDVIRKDH